LIGFELKFAAKNSTFGAMLTHHHELLKQIKAKGGKPIRDPYWQNYLGTPHPLYKMDSATLRKIAQGWLSNNREMKASEFVKVINSLVKGESATEKLMAGLLLDGARPTHRDFPPEHVDGWLDHLVGWVEVDTLCTGNFPKSEVPRQWPKWKKLLNSLSRSANINKRRASLVLLCSPLRKEADRRLLDQALKTVDRLCKEREVLITKAVSWVLRSASRHFAKEVKKYVTLNTPNLPSIAVRETLTKIATGTKAKRKSK